MIKRRTELKRYLEMLDYRYSVLRGSWTPDFIENANVIDQVSVKVAVNDLKTVLTQI